MSDHGTLGPDLADQRPYLLSWVAILAFVATMDEAIHPAFGDSAFPVTSLRTSRTRDAGLDVAVSGG